VLNVKSLIRQNFESSKNLELSKKLFSVFIQTDKSIYKPSDKVQFRVLLLDEETRPFKASKAQIYITDGGNNRLKQFDNVKFEQGVHQNELQLSDSPVLGTWKILVKINNQNEISKQFEVAEYVLPKFELTIDAEPDTDYKNGKVKATVKAKYTFGKIAKGNATVTAEGNRKVTKSIEVSGKKYIEFDIENELGIQKSWSENTVKLSATFTEELSGNEQNATANVRIHVTPHKIKFLKSGEKFKPGLPYKITALLNFHEKNAPVTDKNNPVKFTVEYMTEKKCQPWRYCPKDSYEKITNIFPKNGRAELEIEVPSNVTEINVEVKFFNF
jgi:CD109 antigen